MDSLGLANAYHGFFDEAQGEETRSTYYHRCNTKAPFHIDYCFMPVAWMHQVRNVEVGGYEDWRAASDVLPGLLPSRRGPLQVIRSHSSLDDCFDESPYREVSHHTVRVQSLRNLKLLDLRFSMVTEETIDYQRRGRADLRIEHLLQPPHVGSMFTHSQDLHSRAPFAAAAQRAALDFETFHHGVGNDH
jgi:hypothetical protein